MVQNRRQLEPLALGAKLWSMNHEYCFVNVIGKGCFGTVSKFLNMTTNEVVAIKTIRTSEALRALDPDETNIVRFIESFTVQQSDYLVFQLLDQSLYDMMKKRSWLSLALKEIRPIAHQLLTAAEALHTFGIVHSDLKMDNIMLVNHRLQPFKVKIIDFGLAFTTCEAPLKGIQMQALCQRAPEIILGVPFSKAIDLWSIGCVLSMLFLPIELFRGASEFEVLKHIVSILGQPHDDFLDTGMFTNKFFVRSKHRVDQKWTLKTVNEYVKETQVKMKHQQKLVSRLDDLLVLKPKEDIMDDQRAFVSLLHGLLQVDPKQRLTAGRALKHSFVTMEHLNDVDFSYLSKSSTMMQICAKDSTTPRVYEHALGGRAGAAAERPAAAAPKKRFQQRVWNCFLPLRACFKRTRSPSL